MFVIGHCSADQSLERGDRKLIMFSILNNRVDIECTKKRKQKSLVPCCFNSFIHPAAKRYFSVSNVGNSTPVVHWPAPRWMHTKFWCRLPKLAEICGSYWGQMFFLWHRFNILWAPSCCCCSFEIFLVGSYLPERILWCFQHPAWSWEPKLLGEISEHLPHDETCVKEVAVLFWGEILMPK